MREILLIHRISICPSAYRRTTADIDADFTQLSVQKNHFSWTAMTPNGEQMDTSDKVSFFSDVSPGKKAKKIDQRLSCSPYSFYTFTVLKMMAINSLVSAFSSCLFKPFSCFVFVLVLKASKTSVTFKIH